LRSPAPGRCSSSSGPVSGGAFNPAVALGATLMGLFSWSHIWVNLLANLAGGAAAAYAFRLTDPGRTRFVRT
jgi:aquaporin Z